MKKCEADRLEKLQVKYPPRGSWGWSLMRANRHDDIEYVHSGYCSEKLRRCPVCDRLPVFQEAQEHAMPANEPARIFYGYCPTCELRTRKAGRLKEAVMQWQAGKYSADSWMVCHRPKMDQDGAALLCDKMVGLAIDDAIMYAQLRQNDLEGSEAWTSRGQLLKDLEKFFRTSVFMFNLDADGVISDIRKILYPDLKPKDRTRIPLHLDQLYKGKEIVKKCTQQNSSKKQP